MSYKTVTRKVKKYSFSIISVNTLNKTFQKYASYPTYRMARDEMARLDKMTTSDYSFFIEREDEIVFLETKVFETKYY